MTHEFDDECARRDLQRLMFLDVQRGPQGLEVVAENRLEKAAADYDPAYGWEEDLGTIEEMLRKAHCFQRLTALEIGRLYYSAKRLLPYGDFVRWVKDVGLYSKSAVNDYIHVYECCLGHPELIETIDPTKLQIICRPSFPADLREEIFNIGNISGTNQRILELSRRVRAGELTVDSPEVQEFFADYTRPEVEEMAQRICASLNQKLEPIFDKAVDQLYQLLPRDHSPQLKRAVDRRLRAITHAMKALERAAEAPEE